MYTDYDFRFMAKLGIGIAYSLFGRRALDTPYAEELYKGLWHRPEEEFADVRGATDLMKMHDSNFTKIMGDPYAVTLAILPVPDGVAINLNVGESKNWVIKCASADNLTSDDFALLGVGRVVVLYRQLQRGVELSMPEYIAHKLGNHPHRDLTEFSSKLGLHRDYFKNL